MRFMLLTTLVSLLPMASLAQSPTPAEARRLLKYPKGSLSLGYTNSGKLLNGAQLQPEGPGYRIFPSFVKRSTNHGTQELVGLIERAGKAMKRLHPGAVVGVGNLSREGGGKTGSSVSHKSGRDADIGMFALTKKGRSKNLGAFVAFEKDGWDRKKRFRFDPKRNLDLVLALIEDKKSPVQVIFVADWLKELVLKEGQARGLAQERLNRIETILRQPSDSNPHHHHYHVRLYCSSQDRQFGCLERGDIHPWVDHGEEAFTRRVDGIVALISMQNVRWRHAAVVRLGELRAHSAIGALVQSASDSSLKVGLAALEALGSIAHPDAYQPLRGLLSKSTDVKRIQGILGALLRIELPEIEATTLELLNRVDKGELNLSKKDTRSVRLKALEALQRFGRKASSDVVYRYLLEDDLKLVNAAHRTLRRISNQPIDGRLRGRRQREKVRAQWKRFLSSHGSKSWIEWMRLGFEERGIKLPEEMSEQASYAALMGALISRDDDAAHNAALTLMHLTDHTAYPWWRKKRNNHRHWKSWFREQKQNNSPQ